MDSELNGCECWTRRELMERVLGRRECGRLWSCACAGAGWALWLAAHWLVACVVGENMRKVAHWLRIQWTKATKGAITSIFKELLCTAVDLLLTLLEVMLNTLLSPWKLAYTLLAKWGCTLLQSVNTFIFRFASATIISGSHSTSVLSCIRWW